MEHDGETRRGFGRMGFGFVLFMLFYPSIFFFFLRLEQLSCVCCFAQVQALPEEVPDPRALLQRRLPLPPLPQRVHGSSAVPLLCTPYFSCSVFPCGFSYHVPLALGPGDRIGRRKTGTSSTGTPSNRCNLVLIRCSDIMLVLPCFAG